GYRTKEYDDLMDMYFKTRQEGFGNEVKRRILIGTYVLSAGYYDAYYLKAQKIRRLISEDFTNAFKKCDVIMGPSAPSVAFKAGEKKEDPLAMYMQDIYTISTNLAGLPAMSIPAGFTNNLPVGLQLIGNYFSEAKLLNIAHSYQQHTDWHL
ncbi:MAG TPA: Asp-tRNA(Asn)/Glu-tRNA(Gln) amidotransferase GatCAB subunit A, partial [Methylophilaceae bacterium]|nr:Asp-tRNA(Asn)/Glu-tRNA(Gln) amidotransferase GatCAB subunit A [Methylophilaceae bacterium]